MFKKFNLVVVLKSSVFTQPLPTSVTHTSVSGLRSSVLLLPQKLLPFLRDHIGIPSWFIDKLHLHLMTREVIF